MAISIASSMGRAISKSVSHPTQGIALVLILLLFSATLAGCNSGQAGRGAEPRGAEPHAVALADAKDMPHRVQSAPDGVATAYRFAAANPEVLRQIPCYCGCGAMGHLSNYDCFWQADGQVDAHALGCGICVDIAQDVRRDLARGRSLVDIRAQVDADYARFGPSTDTLPVSEPAN